MKFAMILSALLIFATFFMMLPSTYAKVVGAWLFDEGQTQISQTASGMIEDASANGHDAEIFGEVKWRRGRFGAAVEFIPEPGNPAKQAYLKVEDHADLNLNTFTITGWIKVPGTLKPLQMIFSKGQFFPPPSKARNYSVWIRSDADVLAGPKKSGHLGCGFYVRFPVENHIGQFETRKVTDNEWHFFACSYDGEDLVAYVDEKEEGREENKVAQGLRPKPSKTEYPLLIGAQLDPILPIGQVNKWDPANVGGVHGVVGSVDDLALFDTGLSADEITRIRELGLAAAYDEIQSVDPRDKLATMWARLKTE